MATSLAGQFTTKYSDAMDIIHTDHDPLSGRPLHAVPVICPSGISEGDHILYLINNNDIYRPTYRSALVESVSEGNVSIIVYTPQGVQRHVQQFYLFRSLHRVDYTAGTLSEMAIKRAMQRLGECHYHGLFNNSHHFVSWTKTGLEYSLADLVHGVEGEYLQISCKLFQATFPSLCRLLTSPLTPLISLLIILAAPLNHLD